MINVPALKGIDYAGLLDVPALVNTLAQLYSSHNETQVRLEEIRLMKTVEMEKYRAGLELKTHASDKLYGIAENAIERGGSDDLIIRIIEEARKIIVE